MPSRIIANTQAAYFLSKNAKLYIILKYAGDFDVSNYRKPFGYLGQNTCVTRCNFAVQKQQSGVKPDFRLSNIWVLSMPTSQTNRAGFRHLFETYLVELITNALMTWR